MSPTRWSGEATTNRRHRRVGIALRGFRVRRRLERERACKTGSSKQMYTWLSRAAAAAYGSARARGRGAGACPARLAHAAAGRADLRRRRRRRRRAAWSRSSRATYPQPVLFAVLLVFACLTSIWKVNLPITLTNGSTLSVSYAANLMSLLLLGPQHAVVIAAVGAWTQCNYKAKHLDPLHRSVFSTASAVITMAATGSSTAGWAARRRRPCSPAAEAAGRRGGDLLPGEHEPRRRRHRLLHAAAVLRAPGARISCGAAPASWSPAARARSRPSSSRAASTGRRCCWWRRFT